MPVIVLIGAIAVLWIVWPMLRKMSVRHRWIVLAGGGLAALFLFKGQAVLSAVTALGALAAKFAYSPLFRPVLKVFLLAMPGIAGAKARETRRRTKEEKQCNEAAELLGVTDDASPDAIQRAFVAYMKIHHPDKGGTEEAAKRGAEARDVLLKRRGAEKNTPS